MLSLFNNVRLQVEALSQHGFKAEAEELSNLINKLEANAVNKLLKSFSKQESSLSLAPIEEASI